VGAHDTLYSGTVSAALEGAHWGVPSVAISHCSGDESLMPALQEPLMALLPALLEVAVRTRGAVNVNLPPWDRGPWQGMVSARLGQRFYSNEVVARNDPRGRMYFWIGGTEVTMPDIAGTDCNAIRDGWVSVTPLGNDLTRTDLLGVVDQTLRRTTVTAESTVAQSTVAQSTVVQSTVAQSVGAHSRSTTDHLLGTT
jgi:5'-nucleotidase